MEKFTFGTEVEDTVTGYAGTITARIEYANGDEDQYLVENIDDTGRPISQWVVESRLMPYVEGDEE